jgi:hypothetical protein
MNLKNKISRYLFKIFCIISCLFQINEICVIYFSYQTTTDVRYKEELKVSLPAISICIPKEFMFDLRLTSSISPNETIKSLNSEKILNYLNKLTIKEQFKNLLNIDVVLNDKCFVLASNKSNGNKYYVNCKKITPFRKSINSVSYCFTLFSQLNGENDENYLIDYDSSRITTYHHLVYLQLEDFSARIHLFLHSRNRKFYQNSVFRIFNHYKSERIFINYRKTIVELMPEPYRTSCTDFRKLGHLSRNDCMFKCYVNYYKNLFNKLPERRFIEDINSEFLMIEENNVTFKSFARKKCEKVCGTNPDCYEEYFEFEDYRIVYNNGFEIILNIQFQANLLFKHSAKIEFEEFLCYIMSVIGLWFGFSLIMLNDFFLIIYKISIEFVNKYRARIFIFSNCNFFTDRLFERRTIRNSNFQRRLTLMQ